VRISIFLATNAGAPYSGFPAKRGWVNKLHAAFLNENRTRGNRWRCVQEIRVFHNVLRWEMWEIDGRWRLNFRVDNEAEWGRV
jgi:hypothetical protein